MADTGLHAALEAGYAVLKNGGPADEAVAAAVCELEDAPSFNAGRGAALTDAGEVELDACVMNGDGRSGAVAGITRAKHPVRAALAVRDNTPHHLMSDPAPELLDQWGVERATADYFVTDARRQELKDFQVSQDGRVQHGTVGAVARDASGHVAAATSTGGIVGQMPGRIGDTPVVGAGTYASDGSVAVSCTGTGEVFLTEVAGHSVHTLVSVGGRTLPDSVRTVLDRVADRGGMGGIIAVPAEGAGYLAYNSGVMYYGVADATGMHTHV